MCVTGRVEGEGMLRSHVAQRIARRIASQLDKEGDNIFSRAPQNHSRYLGKRFQPHQPHQHRIQAQHMKP